MPIQQCDHKSRTIAALLIDNFALMSYSAVIEPFRVANILSHCPLFSYLHISTGGREIVSSTGATIRADAKVGDLLKPDLLFVVAGREGMEFRDTDTLTWLRDLAFRGVPIAGIAGGPFLLARAGLLDGVRCTVHWNLADPFVANFPNVAFEPSLFVIDQERLTCAGGSAGFDLSTHVLKGWLGQDLSENVREWCVLARPRSADDAQRSGLSKRYNLNYPPLVKALEAMEENVEFPCSRKEIVRVSGVSQRHLEKMFKKYLRDTVGGIYKKIRITKSHELIEDTSLPITEISLMCGFSSSSLYSRYFRDHYGYTPTECRKRSGWSCKKRLGGPI